MSVRLGLVAAFCFVPAALRASEHFEFHHENVLGTSLEVQVEALSGAAARAAESRALAEIGRLSAVFSSYDATSEFSRWQSATDQPVTISADLFKVLAASDRWNRLSRGAFNPAAEAFTRLWKQAAVDDRVPTATELDATVARVQARHWSLDETRRTATRLTDVPLNLNALAKGAIIDAAAVAAMQASPDVRGVLVNIGGDLRAAGSLAARVAISDPAHDAVNATPAATIEVRNRAVATSGNYRRGFHVAGQWYSHVIDPRTGAPVNRLGSATVVADSTAEANALAVALNVLPTDEGVALAATLSGCEWFVVYANGVQLRSPGWVDLERNANASWRHTLELALADEPAPKRPAAEDNAKAEPVELLELLVKFELNQPPGGRYRRPYLAIWLEDRDEFPVRTAVLWMQTKAPGPRWHRDLLRWYRNDKTRKLADDRDLIETIASATRGPGEYKAVFDGRDDAGKPLKPGKYTVFIEVAREHGTYQLIRHELELGHEPIADTKLKNNAEIKSASFEYRSRDVAAPNTSDSK